MPWLTLGTLLHQNFLEKTMKCVMLPSNAFHLEHITAGHANDGFSNDINLNIEDVCVNDFLFVWQKHKT